MLDVLPKPVNYVPFDQQLAKTMADDHSSQDGPVNLLSLGKFSLRRGYGGL